MTITVEGVSTKSRSLEGSSLLEIGAMLFGCIAFLYSYSNIGRVLTDIWGFPFAQSHFYLITVIFGAILFLISPISLETIVKHRNFVAVLFAYIILELNTLFFTPFGPNTGQVLISNIEYVLITITFLLVFSLCRRADLLVSVLGVVVVVSVGVNLVEYYLPGVLPVFSSVEGRASGFIGDSNASAMFICLPIPLLAFFSPLVHRYAWYVITLAGVFVTFSREGILLWLLLVLCSETLRHHHADGYPLAGLVSTGTKIFLVVAVLAVAVFSAKAGLIDALFPSLDANTRNRLELSTDDNGRFYAAKLGLDAFVNAPIFGNGAGATRDGSAENGPHNMVVMVLAELGLVGGLWFCAYLFSIVRYGLPFGFLLLLMISFNSMFTHNFFEWPGVGMLIAFYLVLTERKLL